MHFDDRLATVLRHRATGERAAKTQFRQLIDLLGEKPQAGDKALKAASYLRLLALADMIPVADRASIVSESGWRFRNPELVRWFGEAHPTIAAAALYRAKLSGTEWEELIPQLPIRARGFLRHRRDLPIEAVRVLDRLGVQDRALPVPDDVPLPAEALANDSEKTEGPTPVTLRQKENSGLHEEADRSVNSERGEGIRALVRRIETFKRNRPNSSEPGESPTLPMEELQSAPARKAVARFDFGTDASGRVDWAEPEILPMVFGFDLAAKPEPNEGDPEIAKSFMMRQPIREARLALRGAETIEGEWIVDAAPRFTQDDGRFIGYIGRFRRPAPALEDKAQRSADRLRQLLHELRTPVNAMQGYAEVIQQQVFGPTPHEYRALAASIAGDSARILAGFDELDRLAKLETGDLDLETGESDFAAIARTQIAQLQSVLSPRVARFDATLSDKAAPLSLAQREAEMLAWRLLATLAGATGAGEAVALELETGEDQVLLRAELPAKLAEADDVFASEVRGGTSTLSSGIFGAGFSLRLARAEARAAHGDLVRQDRFLLLSLPLLFASQNHPSPSDVPGNAAG